MNRTQRLLNLLQILRQYRYPVTGDLLSQKLGISIRTLYRDIAILKAQGAEIEGEPGIGYVLRPGFFLPPLMFSETEMEAIMLGIQWVKTFGDLSLSKSAKTALTKIKEVLPSSAKKIMGDIPLRVGPPSSISAQNEDLSLLRQAIREEVKIEFDYDLIKSKKNVHFINCPITIGYFPEKRILVAWDELVKDYKYFQTDKMKNLKIVNERYLERREILFKNWHSREMKRYQNK